MGIYVGTSPYNKVYFGSTLISKLYVGTALSTGVVTPPDPGVPAPQPGRVYEITKRTGDREAQSTIPQSFYDSMYTESQDPNSHPSLGTYTHTAVKTGLWSDPTTWNTGTIPNANAIVNIASPYTVTYDVVSLTLISGIHVGGRATFKYSTSVRTLLWVDTIMSHGTYIHGSRNDGIPYSGILSSGKITPQSEVVFWQSQAPGATVRLGLVTMGPVRIRGEQKKTRLDINTSVTAGATTITVDNLSTANWRVGDQVVVVSTTYAGTSGTDAQYTGPTSFYGVEKSVIGTVTRTYGYMQSQDEVRTITGVNTGTGVITLNSALTYNHNVNTGTLPDGTSVTVKPKVAMLTHSIRYRSADASDTNWVGDLTNLQKRAHIMFMHNPDVDVRWAEGYNLARTDTNPTLTVPSVYDETFRPLVSNGGAALADANNVRGRYAWHLHGQGAYSGRKMAKLIAISAWSPQTEVPQPGWAITHHNSRAAIEDCVVYNVRGAGIVSENGNETGQWINNTVVWCRGDGFPGSWGGRAESVENHNGAAGVAYECQSRNILSQGNVYASAHNGWLFMQQNVNMLKRIPDQYSLRYLDPSAQGGKDGIVIGDFANDNDTYGIEQAQIPDFHDNIGFASRRGFAVAHRQYTDRGDTMPMIAKRNHTIGVQTPYDIINYTHNYSFYDTFSLGNGKTSNDIAGLFGDNSQQMVFVNCKMKTFQVGLKDQGLGHNFNGFWVAVGGNAGMFEDVTTPFDNSATYQIDGQGSDPTTNWFYNLMGTWSIVSTGANTYTVRPRIWAALDPSAFPQPYPSTVSGIGDGGVRPAGYESATAPFFVLDAGAVTSTNATSLGTLTLKGKIVDGLGVKNWPHNYTGAIHQAPDVLHMNQRTNHYTNGISLVKRNGCFNDNGTWKTRLWFNEGDRLTGDYFQFSIDITLTTGFDTDFLIANTVDPTTTKTILPLGPEDVQLDVAELVPDTTAPTIVSASTATVVGGFAFSSILKANDGHVTWTVVGGADSTFFTIIGNTLSMTAKSYGTPLDANADNFYEVTIRCTDSAGNFTDQAMTVQVQIDTAIQIYDWTFADQNLEALNSGTWFTRVSGAAGSITVSSNKIALITSAGAIYSGRTLGSRNQKLTTSFVGAGGGIILRYTNSTNYMYLQRHFSSTFRLYEVVAGVSTMLASWTIGNAPIILEVNGATAKLYVNGIETAPTTTNGGGLTALNATLTGTQWGMIATSSTSNPWFDDLRIEAI